MKRLKKIYITMLLGSINLKKTIWNVIPGYSLSRVIYENLKYLKNDNEYIEVLNKFFSHINSKAFNILILNANFETRVDKEELYRMRMEIDIFDETEDLLIREVVYDIYTILGIGIDIVLNEEEGEIKKLVYIGDSFKFYEINFLEKTKNKNLEKLLSFSWNGLKYNILEPESIFNSIDKFYKGKRLKFKKIILNASFGLKNGNSIKKSINIIKLNIRKEMISIIKEMNGNYEVIDDFFGKDNANIKIKALIEFDIDIKTCSFCISIIEYKNIDFIVGLLIIILKDIYNNIFFIDENMIFSSIEDNLFIMNEKFNSDMEKKYLKALFEFCK